MNTTPTPVQTDETDVADPARSRFAPWPLWAAAAGILGMVSTVVTDTRVDADEDFDFPVAAEHMATLDYDLFRVGGFTGYLTVICLVIFLAMWRHRVEQRFSWSIGASVVTFGIGVSAAALTLAYGWKGALGNYGHGRPEANTYDDMGLYTYYVMNDFSPYLSWLGVLIASGGLAWMAFREGLVSKVLGALLRAALGRDAAGGRHHRRTRAAGHGGPRDGDRWAVAGVRSQRDHPARRPLTATRLQHVTHWLVGDGETGATRLRS